MPLHYGSSLRDALTYAQSIGCSVRHVRRAGELVFHHPSWGQSSKVNIRRKDAPYHLITLLNRL